MLKIKKRLFPYRILAEFSSYGKWTVFLVVYVKLNAMNDFDELQSANTYGKKIRGNKKLF